MKNKKGLTVIFMMMIIAGKIFAQEAYDIMKRVDSQPNPKTTHALIQMNITDQQGRANQRVIEQWSAIDGSGNTHSVMVFHSPASVKNTRFLSKENGNKDNDQWIFLPSLNRVRRIAGSEEGSSFMGTEFTYYDMGSREIDEFSYRLLGRETVQGYDCYKIESRPKSGIDTPYHKTVSWITVDPQVNSLVKIEIYNTEDSVLKVLTINNLEKISGYWVPTNVTMENKKNSRSTSLVQKRIELDVKINTNRFSQRFLETGRAK